jgi:hypothetical protein
MEFQRKAKIMAGLAPIATKLAAKLGELLDTSEARVTAINAMNLYNTTGECAEIAVLAPLSSVDQLALSFDAMLEDSLPERLPEYKEFKIESKNMRCSTIGMDYTHLAVHIYIQWHTPVEKKEN